VSAGVKRGKGKGRGKKKGKREIITIRNNSLFLEALYHFIIFSPCMVPIKKGGRGGGRGRGSAAS